MAVNHEVRVRVLHRAQDLPKQLQTLTNGEAALIAVRCERLTGHVIEREVGLTVPSKARVEKPRNVRMIQARENLALARGALAHHAALERRVDELQGYPAREQAVGASASHTLPMPPCPSSSSTR
jgi:hypothetical protein